jgi:hypothetical protein
VAAIATLPDSSDRDQHPSADGVGLDLRTQLAVGSGEGSRAWSVTVWPEVGEASGALIQVNGSGSAGAWSNLSDEERQARNLDRANRRARRQMRHYSVRNKLSVLWTLTFRCQACHGPDRCVCGEKRGPADRATVKRLVNLFLKRLRARLKRDLPYLYVIERGKRGTERLHVHLLLARGVPEELLHDAWGHGFVSLRFRPEGGGAREQARRAAAYAAKYVGKALADEDEAWAHSYERSQGFNLRRVRVRVAYESEAISLAVAALGGRVNLTRSDEWEGYTGPPAWVASVP